MADDLQNYKLQLQQVEAALLTDPENTELLKLKQDLDEVIDLTRDLIKTQLEEQKKSAYVEPDSASSRRHYNNQNQQQSSSRQAAGPSSGNAAAVSENNSGDDAADDGDGDDDFDDVEAALLAAEKTVKAGKTWKIGDKCQAKWTEDGVFYDATIEGITEHGEVMVVFDAYQNRSTTTLRELKERIVRNEVFPSTK